MEFSANEAANLTQSLYETEPNSRRLNAYFKNFAQHRELNIFYPVEHLLSYYTLVLIVIGTLFNLTSFLVMQRRNLKKYSCMRILSIAALADALVLYQWNLNTFFKYNLSKPPAYNDLEEISLFWCRWISFCAFSTLQTSSWLLSLVSIDRVMIIYSHAWKTKVSGKPRVVNGLIAAVVSTIFTLNSHILFLNGYTVRKPFANAVVANNSNSSAVRTTGPVPVTTLEQVVCYKRLGDDKYIFPNWNKGKS